MGFFDCKNQRPVRTNKKRRGGWDERGCIVRMQTCLVGHSEAGPFEDTGREQGHAVGGRPFPAPCLHLSAHPHFFILSLSLGLVFVVFLSTYSISLPRKSFSYILSVVATENVLADSNPSAILLGERIRGTGLH